MWSGESRTLRLVLHVRLKPDATIGFACPRAPDAAIALVPITLRTYGPCSAGRSALQMEIIMKPVRFVLAFVTLVLSAAVAYAQGQDFSKVEIKANKVTDKF